MAKALFCLLLAGTLLAASANDSTKGDATAMGGHADDGSASAAADAADAGGDAADANNADDGLPLLQNLARYLPHRAEDKLFLTIAVVLASVGAVVVMSRMGTLRARLPAWADVVFFVRHRRRRTPEERYRPTWGPFAELDAQGGTASAAYKKKRNLDLSRFDFELPQEVFHFSELCARANERHAAGQKIKQSELKEIYGALMKRAMAAIEMANKFQEDMRSLTMLHRRKLISETYWQSVLAAKEEVQGEINQVHAEARALKAGWEKVIMQQAMQMLRHRRAQQAQQKQARAAAVARRDAERNAAQRERDRAANAERNAERAAASLIREEERRDRQRAQREKQAAAGPRKRKTKGKPKFVVV